jgi:O-antigen/teichoic acid export membrane protein
MLSSIVFPVFFFLYIFRNELFVTVLSEKYIPAIPIFAVSILSLPVRAYSFTTVLQRAHKGHIINIGAVAELVLALALMYPLYLFMGLPGVALSFVISTYLQAVFYLIATARHLRVSPLHLLPLRNWTVKFVMYGSVMLAIHYIGALQYTGKATLLLGALGMVILILFTFVFELNRKKHYDRAAEPIQA